MTSVAADHNPESYFDQGRDDIVARLRRPLGRVLDVGCGTGAVGRGLRAAGAESLTGIELVPEVGARARDVYDAVLIGPVEDRLDDLDGPFDTVLCLDVLEHLSDPGSVLRRLLELTAPGGRLQVSVPNARHVSLLRDLVFKGTFGYTDWGHRDRTHLRWFTRRDIAAEVAAAGWTVTDVAYPQLGVSQRLVRPTRGLSTEFLTAQWWVGASRP